MSRLVQWAQESQLPDLLKQQRIHPALSSLLSEAERALMPADTSSFLHSQLRYWATDPAVTTFRSQFQEYLAAVSTSPIKDNFSTIQELAGIIKAWAHQATTSRNVSTMMLLDIIHTELGTTPSEWAAQVRAIVNSEDVASVISSLNAMDTDAAADTKPKKKKEQANHSEQIQPALLLIRSMKSAMAFTWSTGLGQPFWPATAEELGLRASAAPLIQALDLLPDLLQELFGDCSDLAEQWPRFAGNTGQVLHPASPSEWTPVAWRDSILSYNEASITSKMCHWPGHPLPSYETLVAAYSDVPRQAKGGRCRQLPTVPNKYRLHTERMQLIGLATCDTAHSMMVQRLHLKFQQRFADEEALLSSSEMQTQIGLHGLMLLATSHFSQMTKVFLCLSYCTSSHLLCS